MVFCIVGLVVFGILGLFSAKYRDYFSESVRCVTRIATLKPCDTDFDQKMKAKITIKLSKLSPSLAGFNFKHFNKISVFFIVIMFISFGLFLGGIYNYILYGNCNGPNSGGFCIYDSVAIGNTGCDCDPDFATCQILSPGECMTEDCDCQDDECEIG